MDAFCFSILLNFKECFGIFGLFCPINCYFEYRFRILCTFLYMGTYFEKNKMQFFDLQNLNLSTPKIEHFPRSVNNFSIEDFWS